MSKPTKNQHYIWRYYLAAWTNSNSPEGQIICHREDKVFPVSLNKIAQENCFYGVKELSPKERTLIFELTIHNKTGVQRTIHEEWLNLYCAPYDIIDSFTISDCFNFCYADRNIIGNNQEFRNFNIEFVEKLHAMIELTGMPFIKSLRQDNLDFWKDEESRDKFCFFLANQYFRTKKMRDAIISTFERIKQEQYGFSDIHPDNMWIPLALIFSSDVGVNIAQEYSAVLLKTEHERFIVGDQPAINTHATYNIMTPPTEFELFYPISPYSALLITTDQKYTGGQILIISDDEVERYNLLQLRATREQFFAKERKDMDMLIANE